MSKKVNDILKGVAGVGAVIGDTDVVYAAELEQESTSTVEELELGSAAAIATTATAGIGAVLAGVAVVGKKSFGMNPKKPNKK